MMGLMTESFRKNKIGIILMVISSFCVCIGQLYWKMSNAEDALYLAMGFLLYGIGAVVMIAAYKYGSLSVLQPILSINYIFSMLIGFVVLNEQITYLKCLGILIIMLGIFFIGGGDE